MSKLALAKEAGGMDRETVAAAEAGRPGTQARNYGAIESTLTRLETEIGMDEVTVVVDLPSGARVSFTGTPEGAAEAAARFSDLPVPTQAGRAAPQADPAHPGSGRGQRTDSAR